VSRAGTLHQAWAAAQIFLRLYFSERRLCATTASLKPRKRTERF
jgi:hypothetical protein